jgi:ABC-type phosphate/phosphonate transport system substrate-binding protein
MTRGIASLGMYDHAGQRRANDLLWAGIAQRLRGEGVADVPETLERSRSVHDHWRDPGLLFGQICGFPLLKDDTLALRVIGLPVYTAPGCGRGTHRSFLVTRRDDATTLDAYRGRRAAINERGSNTGMNLFRAAIAAIAEGKPFFGAVRETGSHRQSVSAIILEEADIAAIDAVTFAAILRAEPELETSLRILGETVESAAPPFVTSRNTPPETVAALRNAFAEVVADPALSDARAALFLDDILPGGADHYAPLLAIEAEAHAAGYPVLH